MRKSFRVHCVPHVGLIDICITCVSLVVGLQNCCGRPDRLVVARLFQGLSQISGVGLCGSFHLVRCRVERERLRLLDMILMK